MTQSGYSRVERRSRVELSQVPSCKIKDMELKPFPTDLPLPDIQLHADGEWRQGIFRARFTMNGAWDGVRHLTSGIKTGERARELWNSTCFEVFLKPFGQQDYWEWNLSPDGRWNAYHLEAYRQGLQEATSFKRPDLWVQTNEQSWTLTTAIDFTTIPGIRSKGIAVSLTAVIEDLKGRKSYWGPIHTQGKPDFHHPDHFTIRFPPGEN